MDLLFVIKIIFLYILYIFMIWGLTLFLVPRNSMVNVGGVLCKTLYRLRFIRGVMIGSKHYMDKIINISLDMKLNLDILSI